MCFSLCLFSFLLFTSGKGNHLYAARRKSDGKVEAHAFLLSKRRSVFSLMFGERKLQSLGQVPGMSDFLSTHSYDPPFWQWLPMTTAVMLGHGKLSSKVVYEMYKAQSLNCTEEQDLGIRQCVSIPQQAVLGWCQLTVLVSWEDGQAGGASLANGKFLHNFSIASDILKHEEGL